MLVPPELLTGGVAALRCAKRRPSPAALTARHVGHVAAIQIGLRVTPHVRERSIPLAPSNDTVVLSATLVDVDLANAVKEHRTRILRLAEQKVNNRCPIG
ncbi:MAG: hypothetical protein M3300_06150 [Actinomycetota bacterium]|nr:hypothetical protein [Actinomycetota bacterium]